MGAGQSSASGGAAAPPASAEAKTSYYELLGVGRQATDDEIKKAYRRKALELHPDRNYGNVETATALFAEIQSAYEVLSDAQERAWYDSHESAILSGADPADEHFEHNIKVTTADDITRMMRKFNGRVDFSDSPTGFFGFLRDTFDTLAREEDAAASWEGLDYAPYPSFGHKDDGYDDVVKTFYAVWGGFSTKKTFSWKDAYRYSEAPDRRTRRWMEKENRVLREEGIREFNGAVATLVAFVRKRDPRYTPNTQSEAERQKAMRDSAAAQAARARAANEKKLQEEVVPEWTRAREPEEVEESEEEEVVEEVFECVACHKTFKSERQWDAHEKSKKHQKAVYALRKKMQKENKSLGIDEDVPTPGTEEDEMEDGDLDVKPDEPTAEDIADGIEGLEVQDDHDSEGYSSEEQQTADASEDETSITKPTATPADATSESDSEDSDYVPRSRLESRLTDQPTPASDEGADDNASPASTGPKLGKAAQKRAKRAAQQAAADQSDTKFQCAVCNAPFPSKTQLFDHIKKNGHAAPVPVKGGGGGKGKKGKR